MPCKAKDQPPHLLATQNNSLTHICQPLKPATTVISTTAHYLNNKHRNTSVNTSNPITIGFGNNNEPKPRASITNQQNLSLIVATHQPSSTTKYQATITNIIFPNTPPVNHNCHSHLTITKNHSALINQPIINSVAIIGSIQCINLYARSPTTARQSSASTQTFLSH